MEYKTKSERYQVVSPGTAGLAQRIPSKYGARTNEEGKETSKLFALTRNEIIECSQNQY